MNQEKKKGNVLALLPIGVFLVIFLGSGIITGDFYAMPAIVAFLIALAVAFLQNRKLRFNEKITVIAKGVSDENIITMCLIFLCAGAFSGAVTAAGGVESTVNLGLSILPSSVAVVGLFVIGCFISVSMGTSMGTIAALAPIAVGISEKTGFSMAICIGAVVCGAMFGDNLSMISDTTIAAVKTQGCEMKDKFKENFFIVLPAAIVTIIILFVITLNGNYEVTEELSYNVLKVVPYILVLVGALIGINVFVVLIGGTIVSLVVGVATKAIARFEQETGQSVAHYDIRFLKPLDEEMLQEVGQRFTRIVTAEDGVLKGGMGSAVLEYMADHGFTPRVARVGIPDNFVEHGAVKELHRICGMDEEGIIKALKRNPEL